MSKMRAAIKASSKARTVVTYEFADKMCWGGPQEADCENEAGGLEDVDGYPACRDHGGTKPESQK